ncbi:MAG: hypothetical protein KAU16_09080 [Methanophagales archaeon]|nr:hypothetical protein [Methanophagales archaeon]
MEKINIPKRFLDDMKWGERNYSELVKKYPDKWVAIVNEKVVAAGKSLRDTEMEAERRTNKKKELIPVIFVEGAPSILRC